MQSVSRDGVLHNFSVDRKPPGADCFLNNTRAEDNRLSYSQATITIGKMTFAGIAGLEERDLPPGRYERSDR